MSSPGNGDPVDLEEPPTDNKAVDGRGDPVETTPELPTLADKQGYCNGCFIWPSIETENLKLKACARCRVAVYCSKECQIKDWPSHKYVTFGLWFLTPITRVSDL